MGPLLAFVLALSIAGTVIERGGRGAHQFDLGPEREVVAGQVRAVGLEAAGGIRTARYHPKFNTVYVTRTAAGGIAVFPNATPVAGCLLVWRPPAPKSPPGFVDPCAGGQWDWQGRYVSGPERQDLLRLPVTVSDTGRVLIDTLEVAAAPVEALPAEAPPAPPAGEPASPASTTPGALPPAASGDPAAWEWVLVPTVAAPPRTQRTGPGGWLETVGREWGVTAADAAVLLAAFALVAGSLAYAAAVAMRRGSRHRVARDAEVYLEWRNGRRWSRYPEPALSLAPGEEVSIRVRLVNRGRRVARGVEVTVEAEHPLAADLDARTGTVARSTLPDGVRLRWETPRRLPPGGRSRVEVLRLIRNGDEVRALTRVLVVRCRALGGDGETVTHVGVELT